MIRTLRAVLAALTLACASLAAAADAPTYTLDYTIELLPAQDQAKVSVRLGEGSKLVSRINFHVDPARQSQFKADGELHVEGERAIWLPPATGGTFSLVVKVTHQRASGAFDSRMTKDWAIFRGDDMVPSALVKQKKVAQSRARLRFKLPPGWGVDTGWIKAPDGSFYVDNPKRHFDRPVGWMIAGKIGIRLDKMGVTTIAIAAPDGSAMRRMEMLTYLNVVWPEVEHAFGKLPRKILIVGGDDPMWRGGLSSPNSMFMHSSRPLVSGNATSPLLHELSHVITRIRGQKNDDWIAEGLAEFYSIELLRRAGGINDARYLREREWLKKWGKDVTTLRVKKANGRVTARAVVLLQDLDREIRARTGDKHDIDDVTHELIRIGKVSLEDLRRVAEKVAGGKLKTFDSPLLK